MRSSVELSAILRAQWEINYISLYFGYLNNRFTDYFIIYYYILLKIPLLF